MTTRQSPTQLALQALDACTEATRETRRLAEAVHAQALRCALTEGRIGEFIANQSKLNDSLAELLINDLPHLSGELRDLKGRVSIIIWVLGVLFTLLGTAEVLNALV